MIYSSSMSARGDTAVSSVAAPFPGSLQLQNKIENEEEESENEDDSSRRGSPHENDNPDSPKDNSLVNMQIPTQTTKSRKRKRILTNFDESKYLDPATLEAQKKEKERLERLGKLEQTVSLTDHIDQVAALHTQPLPVIDLTDNDFIFDEAKPSGLSDKTAQAYCEPEIIDLSSDEDDIQEIASFRRTTYYSPSRNRWNIPEKERNSYKEMEKQQRIEEERMRRKEHLLRDIERIDLSGGKLIVNRGHPPEDPDIAVAPHLTHTLQPHQLGGICFMYNNVIESLEEYKRSPGLGCILAHSMGLGKTLQIVTFTEIFFRATKAHKVLIIVPINTIQNWLNEFDKWMPKHDETGNVIRNFNVFILGDAVKSYDQRVNLLEQWTKEGGALIIGYDMFRLLLRSTEPKKKTKPRMKLNFINGQRVASDAQETPDMFDQGYTTGGRVKKEANNLIRQALLDPGPELVVCDEGHKIKNLNTGISIALGAIKTTRRIVLTGYPLQNNLIEYYCMVDFVRPKYLGERKTFSIMFEKPIKNGSCVDSTSADWKLAAQRTHVLVEKLKGFVQRRTHHLLKTVLPKSREYVILVRKSHLQHVLYKNFLIYAQSELKAGNTVFNPLKAFAACSKIWNHPDILYKTIESRREKRKKENQASSASSSSSPFGTPNGGFGQNFGMRNNPWGQFGCPDLDIVDVEDDLGIKSKNVKKPNNLLQALMEEEGLDTDLENGLKYDWAEMTMGKAYQSGNLENGYKMKIAMDIIEETIAQGEKILLFSQNLTALDLMEQYLHKKVDENGSRHWIKGRSYFRLDGSTNGTEREKLIKRFNSESTASLFLISTRAGSLGINLVSANRCIILDACWNPCHDAQAVCRVYRYGQQKETFIYRLIMDNSMEKAIFNRQINKHSLQQMVVDDAKVNANVTQKELETLLMYDESLDVADVVSDTSHWDIQDNVLEKVIDKDKHMLAGEPFLHESLIVERDEVLSEQEKMEARVMYEREKNAENLQAFGGSSLTGGFSMKPALNPQFWQQQQYNQQPGSMRPGPMNYQIPFNENTGMLNGGMFNDYGQMSNMMPNGTTAPQQQMHHSYSYPSMSNYQNGFPMYNNGGYAYNNRNNMPYYNSNMPSGQKTYTFSDGSSAVPGLRFHGAQCSSAPVASDRGQMQRIILDRDMSLPNVMEHNRMVNLKTGDEVLLIRSGRTFVRLLNGTVLDASGSILDTTMNMDPINNSVFPMADNLQPPMPSGQVPPLRQLQPEDLIELD